MQPVMQGIETASPPIFQAVIVPHRSLSPRGLRLLVGGLCLVSGAWATAFWLLGAWPVAGFSGAEVLLALALLRHNARGVRASEVLLLTESGLAVIRTDMHGRRQEQTLPAAWLGVSLRERNGRVPGLFLCAGGREEEVARSLGEVEKRDLARVLAEALHSWRNPRFDNPQLRNGE